MQQSIAYWLSTADSCEWRRDHLGVGHHLMQQSEPLRLGRERQQTDAGGVAAGPVETGDEAELNRVWRLYVAQRIRGGLSGYSSSAGLPPSLRRSLRARRRSDMPKPSAARAPLGPGSFPGAAPGDRGPMPAGSNSPMTATTGGLCSTISPVGHCPFPQRCARPSTALRARVRVQVARVSDRPGPIQIPLS